MSALDVIPIPGHPGMYARRVFVEAWQAAGSPPLNSAGRLYADQKYFWDGWVNRLPGFNPADNPDDESQRLAHVRFVAGDIDPTPDRIRRLSEAGLIRPYPYEPWHWELPNVRQYAIVRNIPAAGGNGTTWIESEEDDMKFKYIADDGNGKPFFALISTRTAKFITTYSQTVANGWALFWGQAETMPDGSGIPRQEFLNGLDAIRKTN